METNQEQAVQPTITSQTESVPDSGSKFQPVSTWGYIGIMLVLGIPIVGPIIAIVWAFGGCRKVNQRNFARASLIVSTFLLIISVAVGFAVKKVVTETIEEIEASMGLLEVFSMTEDANNSNVSLDLEGLDSMGDLEDLEEAMTMLGGVSEEDLEEAMTMLEGLSEEDLSIYEDAINELFSDFVFEEQEETQEEAQ